MGSSPAQVSIDWKLLLCTVCSVPSDSGNWILFPADKQLHHVKPLPDLKLISNFAGSLPTERSGQGVAVRMRIPPGRAGGIWGAQTTGKGRRGRAAAGWHVYSSGRDFWVLVEQKFKGCSQVSPVRGDSWQENRLERDQHSQTWEPAGKSRQEHTGDSGSHNNTGSVTRGDLENSLCGTLLEARYCGT